ncbi:hypothetical protein [Terrimonas pollutisoli]|uniref:hypothetical protein n=1 Tax=Terrimonas pollutisoli TaxID=3034147 RepID=UPI0023ECFEF5|nr:hypothetical protein [Terrimonas sp. H1YJ31]
MTNRACRPILLALLVIFFSRCTDGPAKGQDTAEVKGNSTTAPIGGAWEFVGKTVDGESIEKEKISQFKMFHNDFFLLAKDSSGNETRAGSGTFSLNGNIYQETFKYSKAPEYTGAADW